MVEDRLTASLLALGTWLSRIGSRLMAPLGLSQQESVILLAVAERGPIPQKDLRSDLLLERSNVSKAVTHLTSQGLLGTGPSPTDARVILVQITPAGQQLASQCRQVYQEWNRRWLADIDPQRLTGTLSLLHDLRHHDPGGRP